MMATKKEKVQKVKLEMVVEDYNLYPRHRVDSTHVSNLCEAHRSGAQFPPLILQEGTLRVVDGFHRVHCYRRVLDADAQIQAILRIYESEAELLAEAITLNSEHGKGLSRFDYMRCLALSKEVGLDYDRLAESLRILPDRLEKLTASRTAFSPDGDPVALKPAARHKAGQILTKPQQEVQRQLGGNKAQFYLGQIIAIVESDLMPEDSPALILIAQEACTALGSWLAVQSLEEAETA